MSDVPTFTPMRDDDAERIRAGLLITRKPEPGASVIAVWKGQTWAVLRDTYGPVGAAVLQAGPWRDRSFAIPAELAEPEVEAC